LQKSFQGSTVTLEDIFLGRGSVQIIEPFRDFFMIILTQGQMVCDNLYGGSNDRHDETQNPMIPVLRKKLDGEG